VSVEPLPSIVAERQAPGQTLEDLRRRLRQYTDQPLLLTEAHFYRDTSAQAPPLFLSQIQNTSTGEGEMARFECQCAPVNDPKLKIDWLHNGRPITIGEQ